MAIAGSSVAVTFIGVRGGGGGGGGWGCSPLGFFFFFFLNWRYPGKKNK